MIQNDISLPIPTANLFTSAALPSDSVEHREIRSEIPMVQVLVIEDSEAQIQLISGMLRKDDASRFDISIARDLREGLHHLSTTPCDVVLLGLTLPDSTELESCVRLSEAAPDVSIVVLTGLDDEELAVSTLQHGAEDYLVKGQITSHLLVRAACKDGAGEFRVVSFHVNLPCGQER